MRVMLAVNNIRKKSLINDTFNGRLNSFLSTLNFFILKDHHLLRQGGGFSGIVSAANFPTSGFWVVLE